MIYTPRDFTHLLGIKGFSDTMLTNHFALYEGYVNNANKIIDNIEGMDQGTIEAAELERRWGWEFDGMRMHELFFENLTKENTEINKDGDLYKKIVNIYGSFDKWIDCLKSKAMMRGIGWVVLTIDEVKGELFTHWIREHEIGHMVGCKPLLVMDMWEHAYMTDYGIKKTDYINAFIENINWEMVEKRLD